MEENTEALKENNNSEEFEDGIKRLMESENKEPESDEHSDKPGAFIIEQENEESGKEISSDVEIAEADGRFSAPQKVRKDVKRKNKNMGKNEKFKKSNRKEKRLIKRKVFYNNIKKFLKFDKNNIGVVFIRASFSVFDFLVNAIFISAILYCIYVGIKYLESGEPLMVAVSALLILVLSAINSKLM